MTFALIIDHEEVERGEAPYLLRVTGEALQTEDRVNIDEVRVVRVTEGLVPDCNHKAWGSDQTCAELLCRNYISKKR